MAFYTPYRMTSQRIWLARGIAFVADAIQLAVFPLFVAGAISPLEDVLDLIVAVAMTLLVGWHIAFVPSFIVKLMPVADLAPTWTIAALIATRGMKAATPARPVASLPPSGDASSPVL